jgi:hypothetical protein
MRRREFMTVLAAAAHLEILPMLLARGRQGDRMT